MSDPTPTLTDAATELAEEVWTEDEPTAAEIDLMRQVIESDWLTAREAAVRADERERLVTAAKQIIHAAILGVVR